jgi:hypothetical protein
MRLQGDFQDYILGQDPRALGLVESTAAMSAERRLDIYHNAYRARLAELLADTYERVVLYIGDDSFDAAARAYIEAHTPTARNLRFYGGAFPAFLADRFPRDPEVAELAAMDGRLRHAFDAADAAALSVGDLAAVAPEQWDAVVFALHPSASFQRFVWNTPAIWQSLSQESAPPPAKRAPQPVEWLFWRKGLQPHFRSLAPEEALALHAIETGQTFGQVCALLAERHPELDVAACIGAWLRAWIEDGVLAA